MLIQCPECDLQVSDKANTCPHCGYPLKPDAKLKSSRKPNKRRRLPNGFGQISEIKVPLLYLFIEKYSKSEIKALQSFANGLSRDIDAVENAVAYDYSNGFVEGTNSRLKMIKRTMYGRCDKRLLEAKLRYPKATAYG